MIIFRRIHLWLSVPFGIIITLVCFSGAMLVFEPEITRAVNSDVYYVADVKDSAIPLEELMRMVKAALPDSVSITGVTIFSDNERTYQVNISKPRRASLFIDQYSGHIKGRHERIGFFSTMFRLHRWLLDSANPHGDGVRIGKLLVGISTLAFVIALISGVIIWWPGARRKLRQSLAISLSNGWKGFWKGLHVAGGMYALIFVLAMALTGLTWSFDWYRSAFYAVCGVVHTPRNFSRANTDTKPTKESGAILREGESRGHSEFGRWQQVYDEIKAQNPDAPRITVGHESVAVILGNSGNIRASDHYEFNRRTGEIIHSAKYADSAASDKLRGWIYSIHTGCLGGIFTRILWLLGALLGASLPITGYYIWIKKILLKRRFEKSR